MSDDLIGYNEMVDNAMLNVVRQAVDFAIENGLPGKHHFYITFKTEHPGVDIPDHLHKRYPDEMTIVLQHQFWNLSTAGNAVSVDLSFNQKLEHLHIPFASIVTFADPSVNFGLQFHTADAEAAAPAARPKQPAVSKKPDAGKETPVSKKTKSKPSQDDDAASDNVVTLDAFRKK